MQLGVIMSNKKTGNENDTHAGELSLKHLRPVSFDSDTAADAHTILHKVSLTDHETNKFDAECCKKVADKLKRLYESRGLIDGDLTEHHKEMVNFSPEVELQRYLSGQPNQNQLPSENGHSDHQHLVQIPHYSLETPDERILAIVAEGKYLENKMKELGAKGGGINTMKRSIKCLMPDWVLKHFDVITPTHYKALHVHNYTVSRDEAEAFLEACSKVRMGFFCIAEKPSFK